MTARYPITIVVELLPGFYENLEASATWADKEAVAASIVREGTVRQIQTHFPSRAVASAATGAI